MPLDIPETLGRIDRPLGEPSALTEIEERIIAGWQIADTGTGTTSTGPSPTPTDVRRAEEILRLYAVTPGLGTPVPYSPDRYDPRGANQVRIDLTPPISPTPAVHPLGPQARERRAARSWTQYHDIYEEYRKQLHGQILVAPEGSQRYYCLRNLRYYSNRKAARIKRGLKSYLNTAYRDPSFRRLTLREQMNRRESSALSRLKEVCDKDWDKDCFNILAGLSADGFVPNELRTHPVFVAHQAQAGIEETALTDGPFLNLGSDSSYFYGRVLLRLLHAPRPADSDPTKVAYYQTLDKRNRGVRTTISPGKYLQKYYAADNDRAPLPLLTDADIKVMADNWVLSNSHVPVHFKENTDPEGWGWVYSNERGFDSCMSGGGHGGFGPRAMEAYCYPGNGLRLAYLTHSPEDANSAVVARSIVRCFVDANGVEQKQYGRVYGDARLHRQLLALGYTSCPGAFEGAKLKKVPHPRFHGAYLMPYIDRGAKSGGGSASVSHLPDEDCFVIEAGGEYNAGEYSYCRLALKGTRVTDTDYAPDDDDDSGGYDYACPDCAGDCYYYDDTHATINGSVCSECFRGYVEAVVDGTASRPIYRWAHIDECTQADDDTWFADVVDPAHFGYEYSNEYAMWFHRDDVKYVENEADWYPNYRVVQGMGGVWLLAENATLLMLTDRDVYVATDDLEPDHTGKLHWLESVQIDLNTHHLYSEDCSMPDLVFLDAVDLAELDTSSWPVALRDSYTNHVLGQRIAA